MHNGEKRQCLKRGISISETNVSNITFHFLKRITEIRYISLSSPSLYKLQPLDVSVFRPFKRKLVLNDLGVRNIRKIITMNQIAELMKSAFLDSVTAKNITTGFSKLGIWPYTKLIRKKKDFVVQYKSKEKIWIISATNQQISK